MYLRRFCLVYGSVVKYYVNWPEFWVPNNYCETRMQLDKAQFVISHLWRPNDRYPSLTHKSQSIFFSGGPILLESVETKQGFIQSGQFG